MGVVPSQVGVYKVLSDCKSIISAGPGLLEDALHESLQNLRANQLHESILPSLLI